VGARNNSFVGLLDDGRESAGITDIRALAEHLQEHLQTLGNAILLGDSTATPEALHCPFSYYRMIHLIILSMRPETLFLGMVRQDQTILDIVIYLILIHDLFSLSFVIRGKRLW
jgi:hypothetical protein